MWSRPVVARLLKRQQFVYVLPPNAKSSYSSDLTMKKSIKTVLTFTCAMAVAFSAMADQLTPLECLFIDHYNDTNDFSFESDFAHMAHFSDIGRDCVPCYVPLRRRSLDVTISVLPHSNMATLTNASYGLSNCAERTAIFTMVATGASREIEIVCVATRDGGSPCGACRQVLAEFGSDFLVASYAIESKSLQTWTINQLLPDAFSLK